MIPRKKPLKRQQMNPNNLIMPEYKIVNTYIRPEISYEVTGYVHPSTYMCHIKYKGHFNNKKQRSTAITNINKIIFHTHPYNAGFWPSFEDISQLINPLVQVIYTRYGYWILHSLPQIKFSDIETQLKEIWQQMHSFLVQSCMNNHLNDYIINEIYKFCNQFNRFIFIDFYPVLTGCDRSHEYGHKLMHNLPTHITNNAVNQLKRNCMNYHVQKFLNRKI